MSAIFENTIVQDAFFNLICFKITLHNDDTKTGFLRTPCIPSEKDSVPEQWASELREVLAGINNTGDISTYLSSLSFTVANFLNTNANQVFFALCLKLQIMICVHISCRSCVYLSYFSCISRVKLLYILHIPCIIA